MMNCYQRKKQHRRDEEENPRYATWQFVPVQEPPALKLSTN